jgi:D-xylose transport system permease protein
MSLQLSDSKTKNEKRNIQWREYTSAIGLVILVAMSCILTDNFFTVINLVNVLKQVVVPACLAMGMTFVIITGGIDLTVGSMIALFATIAGLLLLNYGWFLVFVVCSIMGAVVGSVHGLFVTKFNIPPFIVTLAGYTAYKGLALLLTNSSSIKVSNKTFLAISSQNIPANATIVLFAILIILTIVKAFRNKKLENSNSKVGLTTILQIIALVFVCLMFVNYGGIPISIAIAVVLFATLNFVLNDTVFGAEVYAIGGNKQAAKLAGINVDRRIIAVYSISGFCAVLGALLTASRLGSGAPQSGVLAEMDAIAAVVIGGTSMSGGVGKLSGTILGVFLIGVLNNILSLLGASSYTQQIAKGLIILAAVLLDMQLSKGES